MLSGEFLSLLHCNNVSKHWSATVCASHFGVLITLEKALSPQVYLCAKIPSLWKSRVFKHCNYIGQQQESNFTLLTGQWPILMLVTLLTDLHTKKPQVRVLVQSKSLGLNWNFCKTKKESTQPCWLFALKSLNYLVWERKRGGSDGGGKG